MTPQMNPGMPGMGGGPEAMAGKINANKSALNPTDAAMMKQDGEIDPNMSVRDYLGKFGIDADGPVSQLLEMYKAEKQKSGMQGKMSALGGGPGMGQPPQASPPPSPGGAMPSGGGGGLDALLGGR